MVLGSATMAFAQVADLQTTYAQTPTQCSNTAKLITISAGKIKGPNFNCDLSNEQPAGTGLWAYDAVCTINEKSINGTMPMGININVDPAYFSISLPGGEDWIDIHPCKPAASSAK